MKTLAFGMLFSFALSAGLAFAADSPDAKHPCKAIRAACEAGGYVKGKHKENGKGLYVDCMQKLMSGASVPGVSVDAATLQACQARKQKHQSK